VKKMRPVLTLSLAVLMCDLAIMMVSPLQFARKLQLLVGHPGSHTHSSNDKGIFIIIIKYFMYIRINKHLLVDCNSVSQG